MISCASRALRSASTRSLKTFGLFFWQLHHGVRFWRRFHSKRRLDLDLFIMDECLLKEWSLVIACGGRGYQRILVVSGQNLPDPFKRLCNILMTLPPLPSPPLHWWVISNQLSTVPSPFILCRRRLTPSVWKLCDPAKIVHPLPPPPPTINMTGPVTIHYLPTWSHLRLEIDFDIVLIFVLKCLYRFYLQ